MDIKPHSRKLINFVNEEVRKSEQAAPHAHHTDDDDERRMSADLCLMSVFVWWRRLQFWKKMVLKNAIENCSLHGRSCFSKMNLHKLSKTREIHVAAMWPNHSCSHSSSRNRFYEYRKLSGTRSLLQTGASWSRIVYFTMQKNQQKLREKLVLFLSSAWKMCSLSRIFYIVCFNLFFPYLYIK